MNIAQDFSSLSLSHGQVLWTIEAIHIVEWLDRPALDSVLKKFRREKIPDFSESGQKGRQGADFAYSYEHLMDCIVAMKLVADGLAFRHVVALMRSDPERLWQHYRRAYLEADTGQGTNLEISSKDGRNLTIGGLYLDFHATISKNNLVMTAGPKLIDPWDAMKRYMGFYQGWHIVGLVRLSQLATEAVRIAKEAPIIKRGRKS
jgi:hypothetical protein